MRRRALVASSLALGLPMLGASSGCTVGMLVGMAVSNANNAEPDALRHIAFGSCIDQTKPQPIWDAVLASTPGLFIFAGDNVYASEQPWSPERLRAAYAMQAAVPGFARLRASVPHMTIWDDHDYGVNDGGAEFAHKAASKQAFLDFWQLPKDDPRRSREGLYHAQIFGPPDRSVQVILLDTRWWRSALKPSDQRGLPGKERYLPDADPGKTMLGDVQWRWLEEQLRAPAQLRLIVSSIQVLAEGHGWERWGNLPRERERLLRMIAQSGAGGVIFLSGDRHIGALYREARGLPYPLYEITSSGITHPWRDAHEAGPNRLGSLVTQPHFGSILVDWTARVLHLGLRGQDGVVLHNRTMVFEHLSI